MLIALALCAAAAARGLSVVASHRAALRVVQGPLFWLELAALAASSALTLAALALELRGLRAGDRRARALAPLGSLFVVLVCAWLLCLALVQPFQRLWFDVALGIAAGAWAAWLLIERGRAPPSSRVHSLARRALFAACLSLVLLELGLRGLAATHSSPLLARAGDAPRAFVERFRCRPGQVRFGFPCNQRGYYDTEFHRRREGERLVASIGDSFNLGSVPHALHFTSVCEKGLGGAVFNLGAAGIGPPEYLWLLVEEALPLDPELVVIDVFVGNDLVFAAVEQDLPNALLRGWLQRDRALSWVVLRRVARIMEERNRRTERGRPVASVQGESAASGLAGDSSLESRFPWLADPSLEEASLSEEAFLRLQTQRANEICRTDPASLASCFEILLAAKRAAGSTPLCVMLIPDEFQVEDGLWETVLANAGSGTALERDRPQRVVADWLARNAIPCLDLLPVLRAVPPMEDGKRHLYHLRDTHFNSRGNRVAGEALAEFLLPLLRR